MKLASSIFNLSVVAVTAFVLYGCATTKETPFEQQSDIEIYNGAVQKLDDGEFKLAAEAFDEVTRQHPYSDLSQKAQVMEAFAHYRGQKYDNVIASLEAFVGLHPAHPDVPYALYLTGLSYYEQLSPPTRDQDDTMRSLRTFNELVTRFPNTSYAKDAKARIILLRDVLASKSMEIGHYYMSQRAYQAAINRFQEVVERYQTTRHVEEALFRVVECYIAMGIHDPAVNTAAVLGHNYPGSEWYKEAYDLLKGDKEAKLKSHKPQSQKAMDAKNNPYAAGESSKKEGALDRLQNWNKGKVAPHPYAAPKK